MTPRAQTKQLGHENYRLLMEEGVLFSERQVEEAIGGLDRTSVTRRGTQT